MTTILHIVASPRGETSKSNALALRYIEKLRANDPAIQVDTLDLWAEDLPAFDGDPAAAKMTFFGDGQMNPAKQAAWDKVAAITARFTAADHYVIGTPMWNGGVSYRLKHYIDIITQPGMLFGFAPERGYFGLLENKRATLFTSSGVWSPGADTKYGEDFHSNYLAWWLNLIGVSQIETVRYQPSLLTEDPQAGFDRALEEALSKAA